MGQPDRAQQHAVIALPIKVDHTGRQWSWLIAPVKDDDLAVSFHDVAIGEKVMIGYGHCRALCKTLRVDTARRPGRGKTARLTDSKNTGGIKRLSPLRARHWRKHV
jgi:hypothetical protein